MTDFAALRAAVDARSDPGRTHWAGCEQDPRHRDCAIRCLLEEVERLQAHITTYETLVETLSAMVTEMSDANDVDYAPEWAGRLEAELAAHRGPRP
jgi:hypothetical protein